MKQHRPQMRRGAMLPLIALLLPAMLLFLGFAVDLAHMQLARVELQAVTDAAARAGASTLSKTDSKKQARQAAKRVARRNRIAGDRLRLNNSDIEFGRSERGANGRFAFQPGGKPANAVRVTGDRTQGSTTGSVPLFFGRFLGRQDFEPQFVTTASFLNIDICLVLDRSGSMAGGKINDLRDAVTVFLQELDESNADEKVALASYATTAESNLPLTFNYDQIRSEVSKFNASGRTAIGEGLRHGISLVDGAGKRSTANQMVILMTDGRHNTGVEPRDLASNAAAKQIIVHTITFGNNADADRMQEVAQMTGGRYMHANDRQELIAVFRELAAQASQLTE